MSLLHVHWSSRILGKKVGMYVILPDQGAPPFATFYLLHGLSDDHTTWLRHTRIEMYSAGLPLIVVMPDGFRGFYTNNDDGPAYADYMAREIPEFVERNFPARPSRAARCIGGLSMGGYGALRLGLAHPDRYASITSHSGALMCGHHPFDRTDVNCRQVFGRRPRGTDHDLYFLAQRAKAAGRLPRIRIDCGTQDFLLQANRDYHRALVRMGIDHEYAEHPGAHDWDYWDLHIRDALAFHARALRLKPAPAPRAPAARR